MKFFIKWLKFWVEKKNGAKKAIYQKKIQLGFSSKIKVPSSARLGTFLARLGSSWNFPAQTHHYKYCAECTLIQCHILLLYLLQIWIWKQIFHTRKKKQWYFVTKIVQTYCEKKLFLGKLEIRGWRPRIHKKIEILKTIYANSERSEQFLVT